MTAAAEHRLQEMYEEHGRRVLAYFIRRTDSESARDGAAEVFLVAWRRIDDVPTGDAFYLSTRGNVTFTKPVTVN